MRNSTRLRFKIKDAVGRITGSDGLYIFYAKQVLESRQSGLGAWVRAGWEDFLLIHGEYMHLPHAQFGYDLHYKHLTMAIPTFTR